MRKKTVNYQCQQAATKDRNTYRIMRVLSLLTVTRMNDFSFVVVRAVPLLLADERLVDLKSQVRLALGIVGLHCRQPIAKRQRANTFITYRLNPSLQNTVEQELTTIACLQ